jgi:hypothetical protein
LLPAAHCRTVGFTRRTKTAHDGYEYASSFRALRADCKTVSKSKFTESPLQVLHACLASAPGP